MVFSSLTFIFAFLPILLSGYYIMQDIKSKNIFLFIAGIFFYAWGEPACVWLILFSIAVNYWLGLIMGRITSGKKLYLAAVIAFNLAILIFFKYSAFLAANINAILPLHLPIPKVPLPIGISFFTFKIISYLADIYRGTAAAEKNFIRFALYVSLFSQLMAGPIARYSAIAPQLLGREHSLALFKSGIERFITGLAKKIILANNLALVADSVFNIKSGAFGTWSAWIGIISYSMQIYLDFSGYSDMAIGLGQMFGFTVDENFNYPYISKSVGEFWRRWHISLGSFFRDYVYIPLGGSRCKNILKNYRNLFIVWFLTGLWHGASWTFICWGLYFGFFIAVERVFLSKLLAKSPALLQHLYLLLVTVLGWVFFRAGNFAESLLFFKRLAGMGPSRDITNPMLLLHDNGLLLIVSALACTPFLKGSAAQLSKHRLYPVFNSVVLLLLYAACIMYMSNSSYNPFIYFKF
ncbi:MAG TPA: membrane-bound O-acyltransferase family protein [Ruminiclostridium sp.]|nr:membrane-bound O-acyltransferase family protein [Ruminiclostridium sp.]